MAQLMRMTDGSQTLLVGLNGWKEGGGGSETDDGCGTRCDGDQFEGHVLFAFKRGLKSLTVYWVLETRQQGEAGLRMQNFSPDSPDDVLLFERVCVSGTKSSCDQAHVSFLTE